MTEEWRPVVGREGLYEVSNLGRVRSLDRKIIRASRSGNPFESVFKGRLLAPQHDVDGYLFVGVGGRKFMKVHRMVLEAFVGLCPEGMECRHSPDPTRDNNRLENLSWSTKAVNGADRRQMGTAPRGSRHVNSKVTEADVVGIRSMYASGVSQRVIAEQFHLAQQNVSDIVRRITWEHVQ